MSKRLIWRGGCILVLLLATSGEVHARGFGGFRGGGFGGFRGGYGGFRAGGFGGYHAASFGGYRAGGFNNFSTFRGGGYGGARETYDRSWAGPSGGSVSVAGARGAVRGPWGGAAAGGVRDVSVEGPGGRTFSTGSARGGAVGRYGGAIAGGTRYGAARLPTDLGLSGYSAISRAGFAHPTYYWNHADLVNRAGVVRAGYVHYGVFTPTWYADHTAAWAPAAWAAAGAAVGAAWEAASWPSLSTWVGIPSEPANFSYGGNVVYQDNTVYVDGTDAGTAEQYAQQADNIADQGRQAQAPPTDAWRSLGVFALVQGDEKSSNDVLQLALNQSGVIRGNFYEALLGTTAPVYGEVDKTTQRAAWSVGNNKTVVYETGIYNLTKPETPILVHFGKEGTQQWLLVRLKKPASGD